MENRRQNLTLVIVALVLLGGIAAAPGLAERLGRSSRGVPASFFGLSTAPKVPPLPVVGTFAKFKALMKKSQLAAGQRAGLPMGGMMWGAGSSKTLALGAATLEAAKDYAYAGYSTTNVQVQGVDEADIVKTDGDYIYQINNQKITITQARPPTAMKVVGSIEPDRAPPIFQPQELYIDDRYLVVVGSSIRTRKLPKENGAPRRPGVPDKPGLMGVPELPDQLMPPDMAVSVAKAIVYDISDKSAPKQIREAELEGDYVSSRKIGASLYLVANKFVDTYALERFRNDSGFFAPAYKDSAGPAKFVNVDYGSIRYFPGTVESTYLMVAGLRLDEPQTAMQVSAYLGAGQNVYATPDNLYVAVSKLAPAKEVKLRKGTIGGRPPAPNMFRPPTANTRIYKFAFNDGETSYQAQGEAPGTILNQYSMDEFNGYFRLATTKGESWASGDSASKNNIYVLDGDLKIFGKIEDLAPGEKIYSARFIDDRAYLVTFKQVDPLFVVDLKNPAAPAVLGELKIPGYSDYLHPYDGNHIIGFGKEAVEVAADPAAGQGGPPAYYQGMKIAVFDVSDVAHPVEKFKTTIGDRGTDSELLHNPKALLFDKKRNLMAFPVTVLEVKDNSSSGGQNSGQLYGEFTFQGAYVYDISLDKGLNLKGRIAHQSPDDKGSGGMAPYGDGNKIVDRALYIGDALYTVSKAKIQANSLPDLKQIGSVEIPN